MKCEKYKYLEILASAIHEGCGHYDTDWNTAIDEFEANKHRFKAEYHGYHRFDYDTISGDYRDSESHDIWLVGYRWETLEEKRERILVKKANRDIKRKKEITLMNNLMKKYGVSK